MQGYELKKFGLKNLEKVKRPDPVCGPTDVVVALKAAALNYRDILMIAGHYNPRLKMPIVPCSDGAGEVIEVGKEVTRFRVGERVIPHFAQTWMAGEADRNIMHHTLGGPLDGTLQEFCSFPESALVKLPDYLSYSEGATTACAALTAWSALITYGQLKPGETVLILGTGGVSIFALQIAKLSGARVIITSSSDEKLKKAEKLGADFMINYKQNPEWDQAVKELVGSQGVDHVIEVGGAGTLERSLRITRPHGQISLIGVLAGAAGKIDLIPALMRNITIQGIFAGHRQGLEYMLQAFEHHQVKPVIDQLYPFDEAKQALKQMESGSHFGKIAIEIAARD